MGCGWLIWDGVFILSLVGWIVPLVGRGSIPPTLGFSALGALILLRAIARISRGGRLSRVVALTYDLGVPIAAFSTILITLTNANLDQIIGIWYAALMAWLIMVWVYSIFFPISFNSSLVIFLSTLTWIVSLYVLYGRINIGNVVLGIVIFMTFIFLRAQAWGRRWNLVDLTFGVGLPIASLLLFSAEFGGVHRDAMLQIVTSIGVLAVTLAGLYIMLVGPFVRR